MKLNPNNPVRPGVVVQFALHARRGRPRHDAERSVSRGKVVRCNGSIVLVERDSGARLWVRRSLLQIAQH